MTEQEQIERARQMVQALCDGQKRWTMSIPARPDDDPDLVISAALAAASEALKERDAQIARLRAENASFTAAATVRVESAEAKIATLTEALEEIYDAFRTAGLEESYTYADGLASAALQSTRPQEQP